MAADFATSLRVGEQELTVEFPEKAEIIFRAPPARRDPTGRRSSAEAGAVEIPADGRDGRRWADYSHAHGGKDGTPFPVDRVTYDRNIGVLTDSVRRARLGETDKFDALRRLARL